MTKHLAIGLAMAGLAFFALPAIAQDAVTIKVTESPEHGQYLTDGEGRSLYLFEADTKGEGGAAPQIACAADCLARWPILVTTGEPVAGEMVDAALLGTADHQGQMVVTYNGWPLYHFVDDAAPGDTNGHDIEEFGAEWYLVTPAGEKADDD